MSEVIIPTEFQRSLGFWATEEQSAFMDSTVVVAGAGGDGGALAEQLVRAGVGRLRLADPEVFDTENINRQAFSNSQTVGRNKAEVVAESLRIINPRLEVEVFNEGVTPANIERIVAGADVVIDETEFTLHSLGVMIARAAREENIPNVMAMNVGFAGTVTAFRPDGATFESMLGLPEDMPLDEVERQEVGLERWLPYLPGYIDLSMLEKVATGEKSAPSVAIGVGMAASMAAVETQLYILEGRGLTNNRRQPIAFPAVRYMDAMTGESGVIEDPLQGHAQSMAEIVAGNVQGVVPKVSY